MANRISRVGVPSLASRTQIVVTPDNGKWYWAFKVNGEVYAAGEAASEAGANTQAVDAYDDWAETQ